VSIAGFAGEKWLLETEPGVRLPAWWFAPPGRKPRGPAAVIVHPEGKQGLLGQRATLVRALLDAHVAVLALDPCFRGELRRNWKWNLVIWGQPEEGLAAADLNRSAAWLRSRDDVDPARVYALGLGPLGPAALFAAALDPRWAGAAADGPWALEAGRPAPDAIPNLLRHGDLPQCAALVAPRPLWLNQAGPAFAFAARAYATLGAAGALRRTEAEPGAWASALGQAWGALLDRGQDH
jgi:poly(3-hydroxybutyrate) depolymerase